MNNYSFLQKKLHQIALSSQFMREVSFDIESSLIKRNYNVNSYIFITGLARSGSTALLNALYKSERFASLSYADMPFVLATNIWSKVILKNRNNKEVERAHGDGIKISTNSPEAFEEVFWKTFPDYNKKTYKKFKKYLELITHKCKKKNYLSKNNQNIRRLQILTKILPNAKILIPFRDPTQQAYSLLSQHKKFIDASKEDVFVSDYMKWIGHTEFGPNYIPLCNLNLKYQNDKDINHWIEQWHLIYKKNYEHFKNNRNVKFVCYEKLCKSEKYWVDILKFSSTNVKHEFSFKFSKRKILNNIDRKLLIKNLHLYKDMCKG